MKRIHMQHTVLKPWVLPGLEDKEEVSNSEKVHMT